MVELETMKLILTFHYLGESGSGKVQILQRIFVSQPSMAVTCTGLSLEILVGFAQEVKLASLERPMI